MRKRSLFFGIVAISFAALVLSGCPQSEGGGSTQPSQVSAPTVDVGAFDATTGKLAATVPSGTKVELSTPTDGAVIFYKFSSVGDDPDPATDGYTDGLPIEIPDDLGDSVTLKTFARKAGWSDSGTLEVVYTVDDTAVPVPTATFSGGVPATGGAVPATTEITVDVQDGTTVYYTTDNSDPTDATNAKRVEYEGPGTVSQLAGEGATSVTLKVAAVKGSDETETASAVRTVVYSIAGVTLTEVKADGGDIKKSTAITLTFDKTVSDLAAENITIIPADSVTKGGLTGEGTEWTLALADVKAGDVWVKVRKGDIDSVPKKVEVKNPGDSVLIKNLTASTAAANAVTLTWKDPTADAFEKVTVEYTSGSGGASPVDVEKGTQTYTATGLTAGVEYTFTVTPVFTGGDKGEPATVKATPQTTSSTGYRVEADGKQDTTTSTKITFTFDEAVALAAGDITVTNGTGKVTKGELTSSDENKVWTLAITVEEAGEVSISISKTGIDTASKTVTVYKGTSVGKKITVTFEGLDSDEDIGLDGANDVPLGTPLTVEVPTNSGFTVTKWSLDDADVTPEANPNTLELTADQLTGKRYNLTVFAEKGGVTYSKRVTFTVTAETEA